jgi:hypothetical protein
VDLARGGRTKVNNWERNGIRKRTRGVKDDTEVEGDGETAGKGRRGETAG